MKDFFQELFEYGHHFNQLIAETILKHSDAVPDHVVKVFSHILNAHQIWNCRINNKPHAFGVWDIHPPREFGSIDKRNFEGSLVILQGLDLESTIHYTNTKGQAFTNTARDILFHIINHSTYHRGQIATEFRKNGIEPITTDYIFYKR